jgi:archaellum component FlaC
MLHLSPTHHETSKCISTHEIDSKVEPPKFLGFKFKRMQINYSSQIKPRTLGFSEVPSLFNTPYCLMAKGELKVCEIDEFTYDDLVEMVSNLDDLLGNMKGRYKNLKKKHVSLQESYEELKTSHENLFDAHERLKEAHNSHISQEANKVKVDVGITCDLLDNMPKIDKVLKSNISTSCDDLLAMPCY